MGELVKDAETLKGLLKNKEWRLNNLYQIIDKQHHAVPFTMNWAQRELEEYLWHKTIILKARQIGCTTFFCIYFLDECIFNSGVNAAIIADTLDNASQIFETKVKYVWENIAAQYPALQKTLHSSFKPTKYQGKEIQFKNDSTIKVTTSGRSGTFHMALVSEYGKMCAKTPEKAREVKTGTLASVPSTGILVIESTAEGETGDFHDKCQVAQTTEQEDRELGTEDYRFFFFPWWRHTENRYKGHVSLSESDLEYFENLDSIMKAQNFDRLTLDQKLWYAKKAVDLDEDIRREHPSTPEEAFAAPLQGAYWGKVLAWLEAKKRVGFFPYNPAYQVHTSWDIGMDDHTFIWFFQEIENERRFMDYIEDREHSVDYYCGLINKRPYTYGSHFGPHDLAVRDWSQSGEIPRFKVAEKLGVKFTITERPKVLIEAIDTTRRFLQSCTFDAGSTHDGVTHLKRYVKKWDKARSIFMDTPERNAHTHAASAMMQAALNLKSIPSKVGNQDRPNRTARQKSRGYMFKRKR